MSEYIFQKTKKSQVFLIICKRISLFHSGKIRTEPTLGRQPIVLGGLYSEFLDEFIPGVSIFSTSDIDENTKTKQMENVHIQLIN